MKWINAEENPPKIVESDENPKSYIVTDGDEIHIHRYYGMYKDAQDWEGNCCKSLDVKWYMDLPKLPQDK